MPGACRTVVVDAPPQVVMDVVTDFERYPEFLPEIEQVEVRAAGPDTWEVRFVTRVIRRLEYTLRLVRSGPHRLDWSLVSGIFQVNDGGWELAPEGAAQTRATYRIDLVLGVFVPQALVNSLVGETLPATLERFKARAERVAAPPETVPPG